MECAILLKMERLIKSVNGRMEKKKWLYGTNFKAVIWLFMSVAE